MDRPVGEEGELGDIGRDIPMPILMLPPAPTRICMGENEGESVGEDAPDDGERRMGDTVAERAWAWAWF